MHANYMQVQKQAKYAIRAGRRFTLGSEALLKPMENTLTMRLQG